MKAKPRIHIISYKKNNKQKIIYFLLSQNFIYFQSKSKYNYLIHTSMTTPEYCTQCPWLFDKMGACKPPEAAFVFSLASFIPYLIIFLFIALSISIRTERQVKMMFLLISCYIVGDKLLKNLFQSARPEGACKKSFGFPSSHMAVICCYALGIWFNCKKSQKAFLVLMVVLQGFARVQLKYHTWEQVLGGVFFAIIYTLIFQSFYQKLTETEMYKKYCTILKISNDQKNKKHKKQ